MSERVLIALTAPYSEVCMHLRVAGTPVLVELRPQGMAQLYTTDGGPISFPITRGEAGIISNQDVPQFIHDCDHCTFLGRWQGRDLYVCPDEPTVIARASDEGPDYVSGLESTMPALLEARARATQLGLVAPPCLTESKAGTRADGFVDVDELLDRMLLLRFPAENQ